MFSARIFGFPYIGFPAARIFGFPYIGFPAARIFGFPYIGFPAARIFTALLPRALCLLAFLQFRTLFGPLF
jgi:hypothetical protein